MLMLTRSVDFIFRRFKFFKSQFVQFASRDTSHSRILKKEDVDDRNNNQHLKLLFTFLSSNDLIDHFCEKSNGIFRRLMYQIILDGQFVPNRKEQEFRLLHGYFWGPRGRRDKRQKKNLKVITLSTFFFIVSQWCLDRGSVLMRDFKSYRSVV